MFTSESAELHRLLSCARDERKTGVVYVYGKAAHGLLRARTMRIRAGELLSVMPRHDTEIDAVSDLLSLEITKVVFNPTGDPGGHERDCGGLTLDDFLTPLAHRESTESRQVDDDRAKLLEREALRLLAGLYGASVYRKVDAIATKHPPGERPEEYLDKCKSIAEVTLGKSAAGKLFDHLYEEIR